jgi:hypothetical protein
MHSPDLHVSSRRLVHNTFRLQLALGVALFCCGWAPAFAGLIPALQAVVAGTIGAVHTHSDTAVTFNRCLFKPLTAFYVVQHLQLSIVVTTIFTAAVAVFTVAQPLPWFTGAIALVCKVLCVACCGILVVTAVWLKMRLRDFVDSIFVDAAMQQLSATSPRPRSIGAGYSAATVVTQARIASPTSSCGSDDGEPLIA